MDLRQLKLNLRKYQIGAKSIMQKRNEKQNKKIEKNVKKGKKN